MTKKQLKQLAKKFADLERVIQTSQDADTIERAKNEQIRLTDSSNMSLDDIISLDDLVFKMLES